jgi:hypothetical protein
VLPNLRPALPMAGPARPIKRHQVSRCDRVIGTTENSAAWRDDGTEARLHDVLRAQARAPPTGTDARLALCWLFLGRLFLHHDRIPLRERLVDGEQQRRGGGERGVG